MSFEIRPATEDDQAAITALVHSERLNPNGLHWPNFIVATDRSGIVGAVQLRRHRGAALELGSLVVAPRARGHGIAAQLIDALLAAEDGTVQMITDANFAAHYDRWGFHPIAPHRAPPPVRLNYRIGRLVCVISWLKRRPLKRLVILERAGTSTARALPQVPITPPSRLRITTVAERGLPP